LSALTFISYDENERKFSIAESASTETLGLVNIIITLSASSGSLDSLVRETELAFVLEIEELNLPFVKEKEEKVKKYTRPPGPAPKAFAK